MVASNTTAPAVRITDSCTFDLSLIDGFSGFINTTRLDFARLADKPKARCPSCFSRADSRKNWTNTYNMKSSPANAIVRKTHIGALLSISSLHAVLTTGRALAV